MDVVGMTVAVYIMTDNVFDISTSDISGRVVKVVGDVSMGGRGVVSSSLTSVEVITEVVVSLSWSPKRRSLSKFSGLSEWAYKTSPRTCRHITSGLYRSMG